MTFISVRGYYTGIYTHILYVYIYTRKVTSSTLEVDLLEKPPKGQKGHFVEDFLFKVQAIDQTPPHGICFRIP